MHQVAALITIDDLCPVYFPEHNMDFGGKMDGQGIIEGLLINTVIRKFPHIKINLFTTPNYRYNIFNPLEPIPDGLFQLSNHREWVNWIKAILQAYPQIVLSYHGWDHWRKGTLRPDEFAGYQSQSETIQALENMVNEFKNVNLPVEKVFRPPGWGINPWLLDWLADNDFILGDKPDMPTCRNPYSPSFFDLGNGKQLKRIPITNQYYSLDEIIKKGGCYIMHFHFTDPNENSLSRHQNVEGFLKTLDYMYNNFSDRIIWLSYHDLWIGAEEKLS
jgi:predicted deacetylase